MIQQSHFWAHTPNNWNQDIEAILAPSYSLPALFNIDTIQKQPKCSLTNKWVLKPCALCVCSVTQSCPTLLHNCISYYFPLTHACCSTILPWGLCSCCFLAWNVVLPTLMVLLSSPPWSLPWASNLNWPSATLSLFFSPEHSASPDYHIFLSL